MNPIPSDGTALTVSEQLSALEKLFVLLDSFALRPSWTLSELAEHTGLARSTAHRILRDLVRHGYLQQLSQEGSYSLGYRLVLLAHSQNPIHLLRQAVLPALEVLAQITGETAAFAVQEGQEVVILAVRESGSAIRFALSEGTRFPLGRGSSGKVLLAFAPPIQLEEVLQPLSQIQRQTLLEELALVRQQGWSYTTSEINLGAAALAVPVRDRTGNLLGALTAGGPANRMNHASINGLLPALHEQARQIMAALG